MRVGQSRVLGIRSVQAPVVPGCPGGRLFSQSSSDEEDGDAVFAQFGTHDFRGVPEFSADLTRQLLAAGEAGSRMWQLSCTLHWDPNRETNALASGHLWSFGMTLEEFFGQVAALPGWAWALTGSQAPRDLATTLAEV